MKNKKLAAFLTAAVMLSSLASCGTEGQTGEGSAVGKNSVVIRLEGDIVVCDDPSVYIAEDGITLTNHGTYVVSGTWNDGQIRVECVDAGELNLILDNAHITNDNQACIVFQKAQKVILTLADGSVNTLTDGAVYAFDNPLDDEPDGVLFSKEDLVITGTGSLSVDGNYKNGIVSKDGLRIDSGRIEVTAYEHGIKGKDYIVINGGEISVDAAGDGIKTTNEESALVGYIEINGGAVNVRSDDEAVQVTSTLTVNGGVLNADSTNNGIRCGGDIIVNGGEVNVDAEDTTLQAVDITVADGASLTVLGYPYKG